MSGRWLVIGTNLDTQGVNSGWWWGEVETHKGLTVNVPWLVVGTNHNTQEVNNGW